MVRFFFALFVLLAMLAAVVGVASAQTTYPYPSVVAPYLSSVLRTPKIAIISIQFTDHQVSHPNQDYLDWIYNAPDSTKARLLEWSRGEFAIRGKNSTDGSLDIFGPYVIAHSSTSCSTSSIATKAKAAMSAAGNSTAGYDHFVIVWQDVGACDWSGKYEGQNIFLRGPRWSTELGFPVWATPNNTLAHEFQHEKVDHANGYQCKDGSTYLSISATLTNCIKYDRANPFDAMGISGGVHPGAFIKRRMGWLTPAEIIDNAPSGRYSLFRHDLAARSGVQLMTWDRGFNGTATAENFRWLFVEHRAEGLLIQVGPDRQYKGNTALVDMTPGSAVGQPMTYEMQDAPLTVGNTFTDPLSGISITLVSIAGNEAVIDVTR